MAPRKRVLQNVHTHFTAVTVLGHRRCSWYFLVLLHYVHVVVCKRHVNVNTYNYVRKNMSRLYGHVSLAIVKKIVIQKQEKSYLCPHLLPSSPLAQCAAWRCRWPAALSDPGPLHCRTQPGKGSSPGWSWRNESSGETGTGAGAVVVVGKKRGSRKIMKMSFAFSPHSWIRTPPNCAHIAPKINCAQPKRISKRCTTQGTTTQIHCYLLGQHEVGGVVFSGHQVYRAHTKQLRQQHVQLHTRNEIVH